MGIPTYRQKQAARLRRDTVSFGEAIDSLLMAHGARPLTHKLSHSDKIHEAFDVLYVLQC